MQRTKDALFQVMATSLPITKSRKSKHDFIFHKTVVMLHLMNTNSHCITFVVSHVSAWFDDRQIHNLPRNDGTKKIVKLW